MNYKNNVFPTTDFLINSCKDIVADFDKMFNNSKKKLYLSDFYVQTDGNNKAHRDKLRNAGFTLNSVNPKYPGKEIKGIYVLANETSNGIEPFYVGISQTVIRRLRQHVFGKTHNHATLAYLMARTKYGQIEGSPYSGKRIDLAYFDRHRPTFQNEIRQARFAIKEIDDDYLLYMAEVFVACHYRSKWNSFETH